MTLHKGIMCGVYKQILHIRFYNHMADRTGRKREREKEREKERENEIEKERERQTERETERSREATSRASGSASRPTIPSGVIISKTVEELHIYRIEALSPSHLLNQIEHRFEVAAEAENCGGKGRG